MVADVVSPSSFGRARWARLAPAMALTPEQKRDLARARESLLHGLANSLGVILANVHLLREAVEDEPEMREVATDVVVAAGKAKREIEALRALEPQRKRRGRLPPAPFSKS